MKRIILFLLWAATAFAQTKIRTDSINGDPFTSTPPTNAILGIGSPNAISLTSSTFVNTNVIVGNDMTGGNYSAGNTSLWGAMTCTGSFNLSPVCDGIAGHVLAYGTITPNGNFIGSLNGGEFEVANTSSGGQFENADGLVASITSFAGNTSFTYWAALRGQGGTNSGTGTVTGAFSAVFEPQTVGTVHYGVWNQNNQLMCNGCFLNWMMAPTTTTSATMTGCPTCLVTVTDTSHGYSTGDLVWVNSANRQYNGFYQITVTDGNHFTYPAKFGYASNASNDGSTNAYKILANPPLAVDGNNSLVLRMPLNTTASAAFQLLRGDGSQVMTYNSPTLFVDPGNVGHALQLGTSAGFNFGGGTAMTGTTGTSHNIVLDTNAVLTTPTFNSITNGKGLQLFNSTTTCTTAASAGANCTTGAISLPVAYSDTNYRLSCTGLSPTNEPLVQTYTKSNTSFTITLVAVTAGAATYGSFDCTADHN